MREREDERRETRGERREDALSGGALPPLWSSAAMNPGADVMRCRCSAARQGLSIVPFLLTLIVCEIPGTCKSGVSQLTSEGRNGPS